MPGAQSPGGGRNPGHAKITAKTLLLRARWVVPVEPAGAVLDNHAVAIRDGKIEAVLPAREAPARFPGHEALDLADHVLIPGLVNAHTHAAMSLMRGLADDLPLMTWLEKHIWPAEARHVSPEFVRDGTLLACGMRSAQGMIVFEFPSAYGSDAEDYLRKGLQLRDRYREDARTSFCLAPHAPYTVSNASFKRISTLAAELDVPIHVHLHETQEEIERSLAEHGVRPIERLRRLDLIGPNLIAVHAVHLLPEEIELLARQGCSVVHCPSSNLKLASGFAPMAQLLRAGVNVALGTDGAASNNRLDLFQEMRTAALLAKAVARDAKAFPAHAALRAATLGGAKALGIESRTGSIVPGKAADLTAVRLSAPELAPCYDPVSHLVYAAGREHVTHVWVDGNLRIREGELVKNLPHGLDTQWEMWQNSLQNFAASKHADH